MDNSEAFKNYSDKSITVFKESLRNVENDKAFRDIRYAERRPELTDEPVSLVSFVVAKKLMEAKEYEKALQYFYRSLPLEKTPYINNEPTFVNIVVCNMLLGNLGEAERILLKYTRYQQNNNLLALLGSIRYWSDSMQGADPKALAGIYRNFSPCDWEFIDRLWLLGFSIKKEAPNRPRQKDKIDELIRKKEDIESQEVVSWRVLKLQRFADNKDYVSFKKLYRELFEKDDLDLKYVLLMAALGVDKVLAKESLLDIKKKHGESRALALIESYMLTMSGEYEAAKNIIEKDAVLKEKSIMGRVILAAYYSEKSDYKTSLKYIDELITQHPNISFFWLQRADINFNKGKTRLAKEDYIKFIEQNPSNTKALLALILSCSAEKDDQNQFKYFRQLLLQPRNSNRAISKAVEKIIKNVPLDGADAFIDKEHIQIVKAGFDLFNNNDIENSLLYFKKAINRELDSEYREYTNLCTGIA